MSFDLVSCLKARNSCIERFIRISREFLALPESDQLAQVSSLELARDAVLRAIQTHDTRITAEAEIESGKPPSEVLLSEIRALLDTKTKLLAEVEQADSQILEVLAGIRQRMLQDMKKSQKCRNTIGKFKSQWADGSESGTELDQKL